MGRKIFVGSSNEAADAANELASDLKRRGHDAKAWTTGFSLSTSMESSFAQHLRDNDYFVVIFTPDIKGNRGNGKPKFFAAPNMPFELGAAYGHKGLHRTILVQDRSVTLPSDLDGIMSIRFEHQRGAAHETMRSVGDQIHSYITERDKHSQPQGDTTRPPIRWLALIKCEPAKQTELVDRIQDRFEDAMKTWSVVLERCGVVWGLPDNFLLSSCPEVQNYVDFIRDLRKSLEGLVAQVDSRLVFPMNYWSNPQENQEYQHQELVLLSCKPAHVEAVYDHLRTIGERGLGARFELQIAATGIAMGDADVFLITRSKNGEQHRKFIEQRLQKDIANRLGANTTSMPITSAWSARQPAKP